MLVRRPAPEWLDVPHFERPERQARTIHVLERAGVLDAVGRLDSRRATREELELVHEPAMIDALEGACVHGRFATVGPEARVGPDSWEPALLAAGNVLAVTDAVLDGEATNGFAIVRPPGHHATPTEPMGFCLFNNVAIAARHAQRRSDVERVAIVDWDVHHGNGTETIFWSDPSVLFVSLHQDDLYPVGRGRASDRGAGAGEGTTVNVPLPAGTGDEGYAYAFERVVAPAIRDFGPDLLFISAGQDPAASDPLGRMSVTAEGFRKLTGRALALAAAASSSSRSATSRSPSGSPGSRRRSPSTRSSSTSRGASAASSARRSTRSRPRSRPDPRSTTISDQLLVETRRSPVSTAYNAGKSGWSRIESRSSSSDAHSATGPSELANAVRR